MNSRYAIEYKADRKSPVQLWAWFDGSKKQARQSAWGLRESLKEECGYMKASVFVDGKRIDKEADRER